MKQATREFETSGLQRGNVIYVEVCRMNVQTNVSENSMIQLHGCVLLIAPVIPIVTMLATKLQVQDLLF